MLNLICYNVNVNFEAMEEKYLEILKHYVNPNDCKTVIQMLLNLHSVSICDSCKFKGCHNLYDSPCDSLNECENTCGNYNEC